MATYIKPSDVTSLVKVKPPVGTPTVDVNQQVENLKAQYGGKTTADLYSALLNVKPPAEQDILQAVGSQYGYLDKMEGLRQQAGEIQRKMLGDQSALFAATNPDGTPVDPRVKVSQFQDTMANYGQRLAQIQKVQSVYAAEMQALAGAVSDSYKAKQADAKTAIDFLQAINAEKKADQALAFEREKFEYTKGKDAQTTAQEREKINLEREKAGLDPLPAIDMGGADLMKALASGKYNGQKFFGVYASGDPTGENRAKLYNTASDMGLEAFVNKYKGPITTEMIYNTAEKYGIDPLMVATILAADSSMGKFGLGSRNFNPGNVGQFDSLGTKGVKGYKNWQEGVDAVGENLRKRLDALSSVAGIKTTPKPFDPMAPNAAGSPPIMSTADGRVMYQDGTFSPSPEEMAAQAATPTAPTEKVFTEEQKNVLRDFAKKDALTEADRTELRRNKLQQADIGTFRQQNKSSMDGSPTLMVIGREYVEGKTPNMDFVKSLSNTYGTSPDEIVKASVREFLKSKNEGLQKVGFRIVNDAPFIVSDDKQRKDLSTALNMVPDTIKKIDRYKEILDEYGGEIFPTNAKDEMDQLYTDILLNVKGEALYNLGVLQKIDLETMEGVLPKAPYLYEWNESERLGRLRNLFLDKVKTNSSIMGLEYIGDQKPGGQSTAPTASPMPTGRFQSQTGSGVGRWQSQNQ